MLPKWYRCFGAIRPRQIRVNATETWAPSGEQVKGAISLRARVHRAPPDTALHTSARHTATPQRAHGPAPRTHVDMNVRTTTKRDSAGHVVLTAAHTTVRCPGLPHTTRSTPDCAHAMFWARFHSSTFVFSLLCTGPRCDRDACGVRRRVRCTHSEVRLTFPTSSTPEFLDRWRGRGRHQSPCPSPTFATLLAYGLGPKVAGPVAWTSKMALGVL